jgi:steroid 5-alpha reductase family enzyme
MTSKTGSTEFQKFPPGPPLVAALSGAAIQLGTLCYVWHGTSARTCLEQPIECILNPFASDPWGRTSVFTVLFAVFMWLVSLRTLPETGTSDPSIVDRLWSIMPWLYAWHWCFAGGFKPRQLIMACLATAWGVRLTYNFFTKGGFSGGEDYRWAVIRRWYPGWKWEVFNLIFICLFQQCAVLGFAVPAVAAMQSDVPLGPLDAVAASLYIILVIGEATADRQMYAFQNEKYRRKAAGESPGEYARGFIETGLWAYSRHPNYFCEVTLWWAFYLFSVSATGRWLNWTIWGPVFLSGLFLLPGASLDVTEQLSSAKYPDYSDYQRRVSKFVPLPPRQKEQ